MHFLMLLLTDIFAIGNPERHVRKASHRSLIIQIVASLDEYFFVKLKD